MKRNNKYLITNLIISLAFLLILHITDRRQSTTADKCQLVASIVYIILSIALFAANRYKISVFLNILLLGLWGVAISLISLLMHYNDEYVISENPLFYDFEAISRNPISCVANVIAILFCVLLIYNSVVLFRAAYKAFKSWLLKK